MSVALPNAVELPSDVPSAVVLLTTVAVEVVVELGLGLGDVDEVHPAHPTANASAITTIKPANTVFFIFILPNYVILVWNKRDEHT